MTILFVGAHPDDIGLGCGGAISFFIENKKEVFCFYLTNGVYSDINNNVIRDLEEILETTKKSLGILGVKEKNISFTDIPATQLQINKEIISELQRYIIDKNIVTVFTHTDPDTYHQDHRAANNITMASARRYINNIFFFEIIFNFAAGLMIPNYYIDISNYFDKKAEALRLHKTEYNKYGKEDWIESIKGQARYRGRQVGTHYAEAFYLMKFLLE